MGDIWDKSVREIAEALVKDLKKLADHFQESSQRYSVEGKITVDGKEYIIDVRVADGPMDDEEGE